MFIKWYRITQINLINMINSFDDYLNNCKSCNLHPKMESIYEKFPNDITNFENTIFYGPSGSGKYTQVLRSICKYSKSELKYEKKMQLQIASGKNSFSIKISDIHYEVDMSLLGCNSKNVWHDIYSQIVDVIKTKKQKYGIIICIDFERTQLDLLDIFYNYMQNNKFGNNYFIKFVLITTSVCFIPSNILNCCQLISVPKPSKITLKKCGISTCAYEITSLNLKNALFNTEKLNTIDNNICNKLISEITNKKRSLSQIREHLYSLLTYNLDIHKCVWYISESLVRDGYIKESDISILYLDLFSFLQLYNNNYRPIYHLESFALKLIRIVDNE